MPNRAMVWGNPFSPRGLATLLAGTVLAAGLAVRWTLLPATVAPEEIERADAVVLFAGSSERLPAAVALMEASKAAVLVIPGGDRAGWTDANRLCVDGGTDDGGNPFEVVCPTPDPVTTRGEARVVGQLAVERGWQSVIAVTSTYHIARAELVLSRCFPGRIQAVGVDREMPRSRWLRLARHEVAGHLAYRLVFRRC